MEDMVEYTGYSIPGLDTIPMAFLDGVANVEELDEGFELWPSDLELYEGQINEWLREE